MKKMYFWCTALLCSAVALTTVSCSDDDDKNELSLVDTQLTTSGINVNEDGGVCEIAVKSNGKWTADVPADCDWVNVIGNEGNGDGKFAVVVDNKYDGISRNAVITVANGDVKYEIPVVQTVNKDNSYESDLAFSKGLGFGYNLNKLVKTASCAINLKGVMALQETDEITWGSMYVGDIRSEAIAEDAKVDSIEKKHDSLTVKLSLEVAYGTFKFGLSGGVSMGEDRKTTTQNVKMAANYPLLDATIDYTQAVLAYKEWQKDGCPSKTEDGTPDYRSAVLNKAFGTKINTLNSLVEKTKATSYKTNSQVKNACAAIVQTYSPVIITKTSIGGCYMLESYFDSVYVKEVFSVDSAKVTATIKAGLFELKGEIDVEYEKSMEEWLQHSRTKAVLKGGSTVAQKNALDAIQSGDFGNSGYKTKINEWANSLTLGQQGSKGNCELLTVDLVPIWIFFSDDAAAILREYILDQPEYQNNEVLQNFIL